MGTSVSPAALDEAPPSKSFVERWAGVFFSPGSTFADIVRKPDFIAPLIVAVVFSIAVKETMLAKVGMERIVRMTIERNGRAQTLSPEQINQAVTQGASMAAILAHVGGLLGPGVILLVYAALGLLIVNGIFGAQVKFPTAFAVTCFANLVNVVGALMVVAMILLGDPERFSPETLAPTNVGFFLNPVETPKPVLALASSLDLFTLWWMVLLGIGFSEATGSQVKAGSIFLGFLGLGAIGVVGKMLLAG
jgi:hypothetical protein